jgi:hypothetical protein
MVPCPFFQYNTFFLRNKDWHEFYVTISNKVY